MSANAKALKALGEDAWKNRADKVNAELFALTYGSLVAQLLKDYEDVAAVNRQLDLMGYNIGTRLIEDFLARSGVPRCNGFLETAEVIAKVGFKLFLNIVPNVVTVSAPAAGASGAGSGTAVHEVALILEDNPLALFVELPEDELDDPGRSGGMRDLWWSNVLCGVLRGALEMVQMQTQVYFVSDTVRGDETTELRIKLVRYLEEQAPLDDD
ncbi:TRAPP I complex [Tilletiopsis washingtonensis]|uniref:Trafficking protein particle complex subunit BET3 n=1 Tax=Tilletiopsis washingtonensis TaxID=58919 RepID=A0A316Z463_9BASI|nr:TRAPP I complex [Tilletiopsis washingtonensis]PWN95748.1 TRAPP I complex [Tilletiopsis washingtonensis]